MIQKTLLFISILLSPLMASAAYIINGIAYNLNNNTKQAIVTSNSSKYTGSVTIPQTVRHSGVTYNVTCIGEYAFHNCSNLTYVTIPNSVTDIGHGAFYGCSNLTSVKIPSNLTSIGSWAFRECSSLTSITIPNSVTYIGDDAFSGCSSLTSVTIPNSVTAIERATFQNCSSLTSVTIPNSVTSIGDDAFSGCSGMTLITIPNSVKSIGYYAFSGCSGLTSVAIPNSVTSIGALAFAECSGLTSATIPNSVTSIGRSIFKGCSSLTSITIPNSVTSIGISAFSGCSGLTSITIPNSVTYIGNDAFKSCSSLTSVTIPNSVTSIGENSFKDCNSLDSVAVLFTRPITINANTFEGIPEKAVLYVPSGSKYLFEKTEGWNLFKTIKEILTDGSTFTALTEEGVEIEYQIISTSEKTCKVSGIKDYRTEGKITIPSEVSSFRVIEIGDVAFAKCSGITSVNNPSSITRIGSSAFAYCSNLSTINLPNSLTTIGNAAFVGCNNLKSIVIPSSVTKIECLYPNGYWDNPFSYCENLESIIVESGNTVYDSREDCNAIIKKYVNSPASATPLHNATLIAGCKNTAIPSSVKAIASRAFAGNGLTHIEIPYTIEDIGSNAFYGNSIQRNQFVNHSTIDAANNNYWGCTILENGFEITNGKLTKYTGSDTKIVIPDIVTSISDYVFSGRDDITSITIPNNVNTIGNFAFSGCTGLTRVELNNNGIASKSYSSSSSIKDIFGEQVKEYILGEDVTSIGNNAFYGSSCLTSLTISQNIISIGTNAFYGCTGELILNCNIPNASSGSKSSFSGSKFSSLIIADGIESIGDYAFYGCSSLISVTLSNTLTSIGREVFSGCYGLNSLSIPNSVTSIKYRAFYDCSGLTSISFGSGLTSIDAQIFKGCKGLTSVVIPNSVTEIGEESFEACTGLTSVTIPNSVKKIGSSFCECTGLTSITIPEGVQSIGKDAFYGCSKLATINIANSVTDIGYRAFQGTTWYNSQPDGIVYAGKVAYIYKGTMPENTSIEFRQGTLGIGGSAFSGRSELTSITTPNSVKTIGGGAFSGCSGLTSVTIPNSVTSIGSSAFDGCTNIKLYLDKNSVALFDLWNNIIKSSTPQMYCRDCIYDINTGKRISLFEKTGSSVRVDKFVPKNYTLTSQSLSINGKKTTMPYHVKGLDPNTSIGEMVLTIEYIDSFGDTQTFSNRENVCTEAINLTTLQPKVISAGNVIVVAESNLDDEETQVGFEWRRIDWTDDFASNTGGAYLYERKMEGYIRNMYTEKLWKYRPYYESNSGNRYYGDWVGIDPTNTSYFEPTVYTYSTNNVSDNTAEVKGYAMRGTDNITSQGFLYWEASPQPSPKARVNRAPTFPANAKMVEAGGNVMIVKLDNLDFDTEYLYVAFVTTSENKTFYGEEQSFRTGAASQEVIDGIDGPTPSPSLVERGTIYDFSGRKLHALQKGLNIIRMSDGTSKKVMTK